MRKIIMKWGLAFCFFIAADGARAAELTAGTLDSWNQYVQAVQARMQQRLGIGKVFLWTNEDPNRAERVRQGQIEVAPANGRGTVSLPNGLIHDWIGAAFVPHTTLNQVLGVIRDYDRYKEFYRPAIAESQLLKPSPEEDQFSLRWVTKVLFVSAALDTQCRFQRVRVDKHRAYSTSYTTKVQEIQNYGKSGERELAPDQGNGFLWRLYSVTRYEERDGGVYLEVEALALTRDIPGSLRWAISPAVKKISQNSLIVSLRQTRSAVHASTELESLAVKATPPALPQGAIGSQGLNGISAAFRR